MPARMSFPLPNTKNPRQGPVGIPISLDFTAVDNISTDLALEQMQGMLDFVQSIYIDNSLNTKSLSIVFSGMAYKITVKAGVQAILPVITQQGALAFKATSVAAAVVVPIIVFNTELPYETWQAV